MKILHVIPNLFKGGAQRIAIDICRELNRREGIEVKLIYFEGRNEFEFLTQEINTVFVDIQFELSFSKKHRIKLVEYEKIVDEFQPDVIHSHLYHAELVSRENPREGVSYITHCHDNIRQLSLQFPMTLMNKQNLVEFLERKRLIKKYLKCKNHFIAISRDGVHYLKRNLPAKLQSSISMLHNAINVAAFSSKHDRSSLKISMINVGNFIPKKNQLFLVDTLSIIRSKGVNSTLTFVGDGETRAAVEKRVRELDLNNSVVFKGRTDDVASELNQGSLYVHSAKYEPFGLVLLEAMASGLPVVSLDGKGNRDIIINGKNGFLVAQGDLERFVQCIIDLFKDPDLYTKIQQAGYKTALEHDITPYVDRLLSLYSSEKNKNALRRSSMGR